MTFLVPMASVGQVIAALQGSASATNTDGSLSSSVSYGSASDDRRIMVIAYGGLTASSGGVNLSSLNIGGAVGGVDILYNVNGSASSIDRVTTIAVARVPSGTSGTISVSYGYSGTLSLSTRRFIVYSIVGVSSNIPLAVTARSATITIPAGGACIGGVVQNAGNNITWAGVTKDLQITQLSSASRQTEEELAGLAVSASPTDYGALTIWAAG